MSENSIFRRSTEIPLEITEKLSKPPPYFLISHDPVFVHPKETVVSTLKNLYERRAQNESFLFLK